MYGLVVEYGPDHNAVPSLDLRWRYRGLLAGLPGYRRRLDLRGDYGQRVVEFHHFTDADDARAALDASERLAFAETYPACRATALALLVRDNGTLSGEVVLLRRSAASSLTGSQLCWRDYLVRDDAALVLW